MDWCEAYDYADHVVITPPYSDNETRNDESTSDDDDDDENDSKLLNRPYSTMFVSARTTIKPNALNQEMTKSCLESTPKLKHSSVFSSHDFASFLPSTIDSKINENVTTSTNNNYNTMDDSNIQSLPMDHYQNEITSFDDLERILLTQPKPQYNNNHNINSSFPFKPLIYRGNEENYEHISLSIEQIDKIMGFHPYGPLHRRFTTNMNCFDSSDLESDDGTDDDDDDDRDNINKKRKKRWNHTRNLPHFKNSNDNNPDIIPISLGHATATPYFGTLSSTLQAKLKSILSGINDDVGDGMGQGHEIDGYHEYNTSYDDICLYDNPTEQQNRNHSKIIPLNGCNNLLQRPQSLTTQCYYPHHYKSTHSKFPSLNPLSMALTYINNCYPHHHQSNSIDAYSQLQKAYNTITSDQKLVENHPSILFQYHIERESLPSFDIVQKMLLSDPPGSNNDHITREQLHIIMTQHKTFLTNFVLSFIPCCTPFTVQTLTIHIVNRLGDLSLCPLAIDKLEMAVAFVDQNCTSSQLCKYTIPTEFDIDTNQHQINLVLYHTQPLPHHHETSCNQNDFNSNLSSSTSTITLTDEHTNLVLESLLPHNPPHSTQFSTSPTHPSLSILNHSNNRSTLPWITNQGNFDNMITTAANRIDNAINSLTTSRLIPVNDYYDGAWLCSQWQGVYNELRENLDNK